MKCIYLFRQICGSVLLWWSMTTAAPVVAQSAPSPSDAERQLQAVMADPLFSRWELRRARASVDGQGIVAEIDPYLDGWSDRIEAFFDWLFNSGQSSPSPSSTSPPGQPWFGSIGSVFKLLGWIMLVITVLLILWLLLSRLRTRGPAAPARLDRQAMTAALEVGNALAAPSDVWAEHARQLAADEDLRSAFRAMYLALLSGLHNAGCIRYRSQQTNWRYVQTFKGDDALRSSFADLTTRFDDIWYGQHHPSSQGFAGVTQQVSALLRDAEREARA